MLPILIVSLKRDVAKRQAITEKLIGLNISFEFIDAVYGKELSDSFCQSLKLKGKLKSRDFPPTRGEIGCSLSHLAAYKRMLMCGMEWACILEDDAILDERFGKFVHSFDANALDVSNLYILGGQEGLSPNKYIAKSYFKRVMCGNQKFYKINNSENYVNRTCCYMVNKNFALNMVNLLERGFYLADDWKSFQEEGVFKNIYLSDFVAHPLDLTFSLIEQERQEGRKVINSKPKGGIYNLIKKIYLAGRILYAQLKRFY